MKVKVTRVVTSARYIWLPDDTDPEKALPLAVDVATQVPWDWIAETCEYKAEEAL